MKKIFSGLLLLVGMLTILPLFAAFEAHVINVTARIENALSLTAQALNFGTVFPQEHLNQKLDIVLSSSFLAEPRVDNVNYFIRQKPKCAVTSNDGAVMLDFPTRTGEVIVNQENNTSNSITRIDCGPAPAGMPTEGGAKWGVLPSLCEYLSKTGEEIELGEAGGDGQDGVLLSFHRPWRVENSQLVWNDTKGYLAKSSNDISDTWTIDLAVPCFGRRPGASGPEGGICAQDWEDFVRRINADALPASQWVQPAENEHKIFGCDLWVEVNGVSLANDEEPPPAEPVTLFRDDFNDNVVLEDDWQAARFGDGGGTPESDVSAQTDGAYEGASARLEDDVGIYRQIDTNGYGSVGLNYCRKTSSASGSDRLRIGWKTGEPSSIWSDWTQLEEVLSFNVWSCVNFVLPADVDDGSFWLAFFMDDGDDDFGWVDEVEIVGTAI